MGGGGALFMRPLIYSEVYLPATKSNVDGFFFPQREIAFKKVGKMKNTNTEKERKEQEMRKIRDNFPPTVVLSLSAQRG